jgi:hypothetical protein
MAAHIHYSPLQNRPVTRGDVVFGFIGALALMAVWLVTMVSIQPRTHATLTDDIHIQRPAISPPTDSELSVTH